MSRSSQPNQPNRRRRRRGGRAGGGGGGVVATAITDQPQLPRVGNDAAARGKGQAKPKERRAAPEVRPTGPPAKRPAVEATAEGDIRLGCPMLSRTRMTLPVFGNHHAPRCALGWALHTEEEVAFCLLTEDLRLCWQAHPERIPALRAEVDAEATAAD